MEKTERYSATRPAVKVLSLNAVEMRPSGAMGFNGLLYRTIGDQEILIRVGDKIYECSHLEKHHDYLVIVSK